MPIFFLIVNIAHAGVITEATPITTILFQVLNFFLSIVGIVGILGLVVSGVMYITAVGDENRMRSAKNMAIGSAIGLVIAMSALILTRQIANFFS